MERLTVKTGVYQNGKHEIIAGMKCGVELNDIFDRLAAYEDTGLEPKEVTDFDRLIKLYLEAGLDKQFVLACIEATKAGMTVDRLRELAQADREGISPCTFCRFNPPSSGDGKPCCMCPAEAALRREQDGVDRWKSTPRNEEGEQRVT